jgi:hypothetical protein
MNRWITNTPQHLNRERLEYHIKAYSLEQRWTKNVGLLVFLLVLGLFEISTPANALTVTTAELTGPGGSSFTPGETIHFGYRLAGMDAPPFPGGPGLNIDLKTIPDAALDAVFAPPPVSILSAQTGDLEGAGSQGVWTAEASVDVFGGLRLTVKPDLCNLPPYSAGPACTTTPGAVITTVDVFAQLSPAIGMVETNTLTVGINSPVPEPDSLVLLGFSLLGFLWFRYRLYRA